jgi:Holliday junction DNA helicase RuvA
VGYEIVASTRTLGDLPAAGETARVYTYLYVREDAMQLFGFASREEKAMFLRLLGVTGVGPKLAMAILGGMSVGELAVALVSRDARAISRIPGVGKKTAQRIIIDLAEKIATTEAIDMGGEAPAGPADKEAETVSALVTLGYNRTEAMRAVSSVKNLGDTTEELILMALKRMGA